MIQDYCKISAEKHIYWLGASKCEGNFMFFTKSPSDDFLPAVSNCPTAVAPIRVNFWSKHEPNNDKGNEHCLEMRSDSRSFNDVACSRVRCMICQSAK